MMRARFFRSSSFLRLVVFSAALCLAACSAPAAVPPGSTLPAASATPGAPDVELPTLLPTVLPPATSAAPTSVVIVVTATFTPTPTAPAVTPAPTRSLPTATPAETATPFPEDVPKVYVTALRVEPATPKAAEGGTFFVTFQNASGEDQGYNWAVEIWDTENDKRPFGLTTPQNSAMPLGVSNLSSTGWTVKGLGECHAYRARAVARDADDNRAAFLQPDGSVLWLDFTVCP